MDFIPNFRSGKPRRDGRKVTHRFWPPENRSQKGQIAFKQFQDGNSSNEMAGKNVSARNWGTTKGKDANTGKGFASTFPAEQEFQCGIVSAPKYDQLKHTWNLSWPAVSQIWTVTLRPSTTICFDKKSAPIVDFVCKENLLFTYLSSNDVLKRTTTKKSQTGVK